ncbi:MAG: UDP-3-O-(3-hydroxymyristoyl)glucosamine N-acyltransferase [Candidatus Omnitrophota bacterium]
MRKTLREIAKIIEGEVVGDPDVLITGISGIKEAREGDITFLANPKYATLAETTRASAIITSEDERGLSKPVIRTANPSLAFVKIVEAFLPSEVNRPQGIHPTAVIGKGVTFGEDVAVGPYTVIEEGVSIGDKTIIYSGCFVGYSSRIGPSALIYPHVSIREQTHIGSRVIIHSGAVIGSDGFGFVTIKGVHHKIPQVGSVEIGDDVEIGANVTIDRARFDKTVIASGTKIDNLVQIAHNVVIGENSIIVSQAGIAGSATIGRGVTLAGQVGIVGHITIGDRAVVMGQSGVTKSIAADTIVWGMPAKPHAFAKRVNACMQNLPKLFETVTQLKKKIEALEAKLRER